MKDIRNTERQHSPPGEQPASDSGVAEAKRVAARRRFLRMGAGGSAAVLVTVVHKRAFAGGGAKKGSVISHCVSIGGVPDIKGMDQKKALQISAGGTLKHTVCYTSPKNPPPPYTCDQPLGGTAPVYGLVQSAKGGWKVKEVARVEVFSDRQMKEGCGLLTSTPKDPRPGMVESVYQYNYRLYKKFSCPIRLNGDRIEYFPPGTGTPNPYSPQLIDSKGKAQDPCADPDLY